MTLTFPSLKSIFDRSFLQSVIGFRNSPSGMKRRFEGGLTAVKNKVPQVAGNFAVWGGLFSAIECSLIYFRSIRIFNF